MDVPLTVNRLANAIDQKFNGLIDISDLQKVSPDEIRETSSIASILAAYAITSLTGCDPKEAALSITDGSGGQGDRCNIFRRPQIKPYI